MLGICRNCGAEIDWMQTPEGHTIPVDTDPVFIIENEGRDRFYTEEEGVLVGRRARPEEVQTKEATLSGKLWGHPWRRWWANRRWRRN